MREIEIRKPAKRGLAANRVRRLEFRGPELIAWVGSPAATTSESADQTHAIVAHDLATGETRDLTYPWFEDSLDWGVSTLDPVLSPDGQILAHESSEYDEMALVFNQIGPDDSRSWPPLPTCAHGLGGFVFTPDGSELLAVHNVAVSGGRYAPQIMRFLTRVLYDPPKRFLERANPLTGQPYRAPVYDLRWRTGPQLPSGACATTVILSPNGRQIAVGDGGGGLNVVWLNGRQLVTFPWTGRANLRDRAVTKAAFSPDARQVAWIANGRVFCDVPADAGTGWQTKSALGYAHDLAFHPSGRFLCAVFADGQARHLNASTGAVAQSFKWSKKLKPLYSVAFAPDGLTCAAGTAGGKVILWDVDV